MTETSAPASPRSAAATRKGAVVTSVVALVLGVVEALAGAWFWYLTDIDPSDDPLVSLGYLVALVVGVPGAVGIVLAGLGWWLADRTAGLVLAVLAAVAVAGPALLFLGFANPGAW